MSLRSFPWWTPDAVIFVKKILTKNSKVLEFGCGGSTPWLCKLSDSVVSIEHNPKWHSIVSSQKNSNLDIKLLNRPYNNVCDTFKDNTFDFIMVDGRDRVLCFKSALRILKPGGWIGLDDASRERYKEAWDSVSTWENYKTINHDEPELKTGSRKTWFWKKPK